MHHVYLLRSLADPKQTYTFFLAVVQKEAANTSESP